MSVCTFFGHRDCYGLDENDLNHAIEELIQTGVNTFYVGNHGNFDNSVFSTLFKLKKLYQSISISVVLAYLPHQNSVDIYDGYSLYPEGMEIGPKRFAIDRRNKWMLKQAMGGYCICFVNHDHGGAYKYAKLAKERGVKIINLGTAKL